MTRVVENAADYEEALGEVERLVERDPAPGTPDADRLELLTLLIQNYEVRQAPLRLPDPIEAIRFRMEQQGLNQSSTSATSFPSSEVGVKSLRCYRASGR